MINNTTDVVNGQGQIKNENITKVVSNLMDVNNIPIKNVRIGGIYVAYKMFGKGDPLLLIRGSDKVMDLWSNPFLLELSKNHKVIIFDNRSVGDTTSGTNPFPLLNLLKILQGC